MADIPSWTRSLLDSRLGQGEEIASVDVIEESATSKLAVAFTPNRTFLTRKGLIGDGTVSEITPPEPLSLDDRRTVGCTACDTEFHVYSDDPVGHCIACGADLDTDGTAEPDEDGAAEPETSDDPDQPALTDVRGIGPGYADRLHDAGVETVDDLLEMDVDAVAGEVDVPAGRLENLQELGGLLHVPGVGEATAKELIRRGVGDVDALADLSVDELSDVDWIAPGRAEEILDAADEAR